MRKVTALVVTGFADSALLRFQLETLELRRESLRDEKGDLDCRLITFNRRSYIPLSKVSIKTQGCIDHDADGAQRVIGGHEAIQVRQRE